MQKYFGLGLVLWMCVTVADASATVITYTVTDLPTGNQGTGLAPVASYRCNYFISGFTFSANQELDIQFSSALYGTLSNGIAGAGFDLMLVQPDNRPGLNWPGYYSLFALTDNPSLSQPFSVDVTFLGSSDPGAQAFSILQFDQNGTVVSTLETGFTAPASPGSVPEPASVSLCVMGLLAAGTGCVLKRRRE